MTRRKTQPLHLFEGYGVELEYMLVDRDTLAVRPIVDEIIRREAGRYVNEVETGDLAWSNELVNHVIELKTNGPAPTMAGLETKFEADVRRLNRILAGSGDMLLPTAMHPLMDPSRETRLWPHRGRSIYQTYHRIFNCFAHGWANLQCTHINLPFGDDREFGRLHAAVRLVLPLLPALAASSPIREGRLTGTLDTRLEIYRVNQRLVPSIAGDVIPEPVFSRKEYRREILDRIYRDIAPHDERGTLRHEWLNSRGAIARFQRNAIEIRIVDIQECPRADVAIATAAVAVIRALVAEDLAPYEAQRAFPTGTLKRILLRAAADAERTEIEESALLRALQFPGRRCRADELWRHLLSRAEPHMPELAAYRSVLDFILERGCLARRIVESMNGDISRESIQTVYKALAQCLEKGKLYAA